MYGQKSYVNRPLSKAFAASYNAIERFKVYGNGDVWAYGYYFLSDLKWKENIVPITDALNKVLSLNGVSFNYMPEELNDPNDTITIISTGPPKTLIGLIAEDVEPVVPEVVETFEDGYKGISYGNLVALLIEAIKEQEKKINDLELNLSSYGNNPNQDQFILDNGNLKVGEITKEKVANDHTDFKMPVLYQNKPNPFREATNIQYYLPANTSDASILIFDMQGVLLNTFKLMNKGNSSLEISGGELKPGMYMYSLISDGKEIDTKKMILTN